MLLGCAWCVAAPAGAQDTDLGDPPTQPPSSTEDAAPSSAPDADVEGSPHPATEDSQADDRREASGTGPAADEPERARPEIEVNEPVQQAYAVSRHWRIDPGAKFTDGIVLEGGRLELGGETTLVTSDAAFWDAPLDLTDLALLGLHGRGSLTGWLELFARTQLLTKQPAMLDESVFQGASLGARMALADRYALTTSVEGGPLLANPGWYGRAGLDLSTKQRIDDVVRFELRAGYRYTGLQFDPSPERDFQLHELMLGAQAILGRRDGGGLVGLEYRLPVTSGPDAAVADPVTPQRLDPGVQLDVHIGGLVSVGDARNWDLYAIYTFIDRGEAADPSTMLPIIDGGFDQQQLTVGVQHRFGADTRPPHPR